MPASPPVCLCTRSAANGETRSVGSGNPLPRSISGYIDVCSMTIWILRWLKQGSRSPSGELGISGVRCPDYVQTLSDC
jgi:hypothetical protein